MSTNQFPDPNVELMVHPSAAAPTDTESSTSIKETGSAFWQLFLAFCTWVASWFTLLLVPVVVALPYIVYRMKVSEVVFESLVTDKTVILLTLLGVIPAHALTILVAWAAVTGWGKRPFWETIRWSWPDEVDPLRRAVLIGSTVVFAAVLLSLGWLITWKLGGQETQIDQLIKSSFAARLTTAFLAAATAPFVEEVVYRGVIYSAVDRAFGTIAAVLVVSAMFALVHVPQYATNLAVLSVILMLSITLTLVRAGTGRLFPCFLIHLVFNGIQSIQIVVTPFLESRHPEKTAGAILHVIGLLGKPLG